MCCENPIELDCVSSCGDIIIPLAITADYTIKTSFLGSVFNVDFALNASSYAVIDKTNLNEDYVYTFGVYNASNVLSGCYQIKIHPSAVCCEAGIISSTHVVADYACFNSDDFLTQFVGNGNQYGYECTFAKFNGKIYDNIPVQWFALTDINRVPVQVAPRDTISAHNTDNPATNFLSYDRNWIDFLQSLPIAEKLIFRTSPFTDGVIVDTVVNSGTFINQQRDANYPYNNIGGSSPVDNFGATYGEGFQIECAKGDQFILTIKCWYRVGTDNDSAVLGHTVTYRDESYTVDGAILYPANKREFQHV